MQSMRVVWWGLPRSGRIGAVVAAAEDVVGKCQGVRLMRHDSGSAREFVTGRRWGLGRVDRTGRCVGLGPLQGRGRRDTGWGRAIGWRGMVGVTQNDLGTVVGGGGVESHTPPLSEVQFGFPKGTNGRKDEAMTRAKAKVQYMLQDGDFALLTPVRSDSMVVSYMLAELEKAAIRRWGSEKEFCREQLRREIKRRRNELRQRSSVAIADSLSSSVSAAAPLFGGVASLSTFIARNVPKPLARINRNELYGGLPWDPALGQPPADTSVVGSKAVYTAIATNGIMVVSKMGAFVMTGSASVLSEAVHSIADLGNQCLLVVGISQSLKEPDATHPYGYATERYVWSLISGVGIFFLGCGVSVYHGLAGLMHPHEIEHYYLGMAVLSSAFAVEGYSMYVALIECRHEAKKQDQSLYDYVVHGSDAMNVAVLAEDAVAVLGCGIAATCLTLSYVTGNPLWDSAGSIAIGGLLGCAAMALINKNRDLLVGTSVPPQRLAKVVRLLEGDPIVDSVHDVKAIMIGSDRGRFKAEINFNGQELARRCVKRMKGKGSFEAFRQPTINDTEVSAALTLYSNQLLAQLGDEVDRLEGMIRQELPEIRHVDLEVL